MAKIDEIINDFFDFSKPCPSEVPMCEKVRESYKAELEKIKNSPGCSSCATSKLKSRFVEAVWKETMDFLSKPK